MILKDNNSQLKILTPDGYKDFYGIKQSEKECYRVVHSDGEIIVSIDHKFQLYDDTFEEIQNIIPGEIIKHKNGFYSKILRKIPIGIRKVYSPIQVKDTETYISNDIVSHNCSFIGSSKTLVSGDAIEKLRVENPIKIAYDYCMRVYEEPVKGALYIMGVDSATGTGGDYSAFQVLRVYNSRRIEQVCCYNSNVVKVGEYSRIVHETSLRYNNAMMIVESDNIGEQVCNELWYTLESENMINTDKKVLGTKATKKSKLNACIKLRDFIEEGRLLVKDSTTIEQLSRFEETNQPNVFKGASGINDDLVSSLYWAVYCYMQPEIEKEDESINIERENEETDYIPVFASSNSIDGDDGDFWGDFN